MTEARLITNPEERREILEAASDALGEDIPIDDAPPLRTRSERDQRLRPKPVDTPPTSSETAAPAETPISSEIKKEPRLKRFGRGFYNVILNPMLPMGKSKVGYGIGVAAGMIANTSHVAGLGVPARLALTAATFGSSLYLERWNKHKREGAKSETEIAAIEKKYLRANKFIRGVSAGLAVTSVANLVAPSFIEKITDSNVWQNIGITAKKFITDFSEFHNIPTSGVGEGAGNMAGLFKRFSQNLVENAPPDALESVANNIPTEGAIGGSITVPESVVDQAENIRGAANDIAEALSNDSATVGAEAYSVNIPVGEQAGVELGFTPNENFFKIQEVLRERFPDAYENFAEKFGDSVTIDSVPDSLDASSVTSEQLSWTNSDAGALEPFLQESADLQAEAVSNRVFDTAHGMLVETGPGEPVEMILDELGVDTSALYSSRETMTQLILQNEQVFRSINPGAVMEFGEVFTQNQEVPMHRLTAVVKYLLETSPKFKTAAILIPSILFLDSRYKKKK